MGARGDDEDRAGEPLQLHFLRLQFSRAAKAKVPRIATSRVMLAGSGTGVISSAPLSG